MFNAFIPGQPRRAMFKWTYSINILFWIRRAQLVHIKHLERLSEYCLHQQEHVMKVWTDITTKFIDTYVSTGVYPA